MITLNKFLTVLLVAVFALSSVSVYQAFAQNDPGNDDFVGNEQMDDSDDEDMDDMDSDDDMDDMNTTNTNPGVTAPAAPTMLPQTGVSLS